MQTRVDVEVAEYAGARGLSRCARASLRDAELLRSVPPGDKTQSTRTSTAAAAALNLGSSRPSDRLLVAGAHNRGGGGATEVEAEAGGGGGCGGGDSAVRRAELRGTGTDTGHGGAESSSCHGATTT